VDSLEGKVAVVTGAASGIGLGMTEAFADRGMKVVMADVEKAVLNAEAERLSNANFDVTPCVTDVRWREELDKLLATAVDAYGKVHVLCNNAGVSGGLGSGGDGPGLWNTTDQEWDWVMSVNLQGVLQGVRAFVPHMLEHGETSHVVNTSSILGLTSGDGSVYSISKHAVARLSEGLYHDLQNQSADVGVTLLCPGMIATNIITSARNRPDDIAPDNAEPSAMQQEIMKRLDSHFKEAGMPPREVGDMVAEAILNNQFYLLTHADNMAGVEKRFEDLTHLRNPAPGQGWGIPGVG